MTTDADRRIDDSAAEHITLRLRHVQFFHTCPSGKRQHHNPDKYNFHRVASINRVPLSSHLLEHFASEMPGGRGNVRG